MKKLFDNIDLDNDSKFSIFEVIIIVFISTIFGIVIGSSITMTKSDVYSIKKDSNLREVVSTYNNIMNNYYKDTNGRDLANAAIEGMVDSLDDEYSNYMNDSASNSFKKSVDGSFIGIGVTVKYNGEYNVVSEVTDSGPAYKAGIMVGDIIVKVSGKSAKGVYGDDFSKLFNGKRGSSISITIKRDNKNIEFKVKRDVIQIDSVTSHIFNDSNSSIGYIGVSIVSTNTYKQFKSALKKLEKSNISSLIIDLRDNPGGHLAQTRDILSLFFDKKTVVYEIKNKSGVEKIYSESNSRREYPIVVIVNNGSASAAEVIASCFRDNYKDIVLVGTTTYGKGTVQQSVNLSTGTSIKYTTEEWLTSRGKSINGKGIKPDIYIEQSSEYLENPNYKNDTQLNRAIKILQEKD